MFAAQRISDRSRVTSISSQWDDNEEVLRELARSGELVCPGCEQLLWLRTGEVRRRHFAHRDLSECPIGKQSPEVLEAPWRKAVADILEEATLMVPEQRFDVHQGGRIGRHTEHLGLLLAEMQFLQRAYPGAEW